MMKITNRRLKRIITEIAIEHEVSVRRLIAEQEVKDLTGEGSFGKAFKAARKAGTLKFKFKKKTHGTRLKGESSSDHKKKMESNRGNKSSGSSESSGSFADAMARKALNRNIRKT